MDGIFQRRFLVLGKAATTYGINSCLPNRNGQSMGAGSEQMASSFV